MTERPYNPLQDLPKPHTEAAPREAFDDVLEKGVELIGAQEYSAAFNLFARRLDALAKSNPAELETEKIQKPARSALKRLWSVFAKDVDSSKAMHERLTSMSSLTEEDRAKWKADPRHSADSIGWEEIVERSREIAGAEEEHMELTGELYNSVFPLLAKKIEGYLKPLMRGDRGMTNYLPVTGELLRSMTSNYLDQALELARILGVADLKREQAIRNADELF